MHGTDSEVFLVGDLRVDVGQQHVTRADIEINLPNLSFQLLLALIRVAPNVLSNDLIMARVWPGLIVSPETVAKRVNLLREALGDNAQEPRYIAGLRSRGYRLIAAVSRVLPPTPSVENLSPAPALNPTRWVLDERYGGNRDSIAQHEDEPQVVGIVASFVGSISRNRRRYAYGQQKSHREHATVEWHSAARHSGG